MSVALATRPVDGFGTRPSAERRRVAFGRTLSPVLPPLLRSRSVAINSTTQDSTQTAPGSNAGRGPIARSTDTSRSSNINSLGGASPRVSRSDRTSTSTSSPRPKPPFVVSARYIPISSPSTSTTNRRRRPISTNPKSSTNTAANPDTSSAAPISCTACTTPLTNPTKIIRAPGCYHAYCCPCLKRRILLCTTDESLYPPRCCNSSPSVTGTTIRALLSVSEMKKYNAAETQYRTPHSRRIFCPKASCGRFIPLPDRIRVGQGWGKINCKECKTSICVNCKEVFHFEAKEGCGDDVNEGLKAVLDMAKRMGWQRCYRCKSMVERIEGCPHMSCRCNAQFCYRCGGKYPNCRCS